LFKWNDPTTTASSGWKTNDHMLWLPNKGSPKENWKQNSGRLREAMKDNDLIYDSFRDKFTGDQIPTKGFLNAERSLLESKGWIYNKNKGAYQKSNTI